METKFGASDTQANIRRHSGLEGKICEGNFDNMTRELSWLGTPARYFFLADKECRLLRGEEVLHRAFHVEKEPVRSTRCQVVSEQPSSDGVRGRMQEAIVVDVTWTVDDKPLGYKKK